MFADLFEAALERFKIFIKIISSNKGIEIIHPTRSEVGSEPLLFPTSLFPQTMAANQDNVQALLTEHGEIVAHITLPPLKSSLLHYHPIAEESYYILSGKGVMMLNEERFDVKGGDAVLVKPNTRHQISNPDSSEDLKFIAICAPSWEPTNSVYL